VRQQIEQADLVALASRELRQICKDGIAERNFTALHQHHERGGGDGFGDRGDNVDRIGLGSEALVQRDGPAPRDKDGSRSKTALPNLRFDERPPT